MILRNRQREQRGKELDRFLDRKSVLAECLFEFVYFLLRGIICLKLPQPVE